MKEINITVPEGYEIDKENSTFECIKFKKKVEKIDTWKNISIIRGHFITTDSTLVEVGRLRENGDKNVFSSEKYAKSALAMAQISQLMPYYGGEITKEEWGNSDLPKHIVYRLDHHYELETVYRTFDLLAFHKKEQRDRFLSFPENVQLVKDYLMID